jgi:hypothetical protein
VCSTSQLVFVWCTWFADAMKAANSTVLNISLDGFASVRADNSLSTRDERGGWSMSQNVFVLAHQTSSSRQLASLPPALSRRGHPFVCCTRDTAIVHLLVQMVAAAAAGGVGEYIVLWPSAPILVGQCHSCHEQTQQ